MMQHRADIQGLRALAITLVVAAHANMPGLQSGFVGVDIFFVLSGYLITGLLVEEHRRNGRIDLVLFYARRLRRLLPALLLMLVVSGLACWVLLPASSQHDQATAGASAAIWLSNLHFAFSNFDYFGASAETNIYLHTWSLAVEEQYYLIWPGLVITLLSTRRNSAQAAGNRLALGLAAVGLVSLVGCLWVTAGASYLAFYLMPTRAWQFAMGALVFVLSHPRRTIATNTSRVPRLLCGIAGLLLLIFALLVIDNSTVYPGIWSVIPTVATVLLLIAGNPGQPGIVTAGLSAKPLQALGAVSYSWYLWHWPVLVLGKAAFPEGGGVYIAVLVGLSLLVAIAAYRWVESPIRQNPILLQRPRRAVIGSMAAMAVGFAFCVSWIRVSDSQMISLAAGNPPHKAEVARIYPMGCDDWYHSSQLKPCHFGPIDAKHTAVIIGDSIGLHWFPALEKIFSSPDWHLVVLTKSACPMVDKPIHYARIGREYIECATWRRQALAYVANLHPDFVVLGSSHTAPYTEQEWREGTRSVLSHLAPHAARIVVLRSTPVLGFNGPTCLGSDSVVRKLMGLRDACSSPAVDLQSDRVAGWITDAARPWHNIRLVDMNDLVCPQGICRAQINGIPVFSDTQHLNAVFAATLATSLAERMGIVRPAGNSSSGVMGSAGRSVSIQLKDEGPRDRAASNTDSRCAGSPSSPHRP